MHRYLRYSVLGLVAGFCLLLPWLSFKSWTYPLMAQSMLIMLVGFGAGIFLVISLLGKWLPLPTSKLGWWVGGYYLSLILSTLFSVLPLRSLLGAYTFIGDGLLFLLALLPLVLLVLALNPTSRERRWFLLLLYIQGCLISLQTVLEAVHGGFPDSATRAISPLTNSDYGIAYLLLVLPLGIAVIGDLWRRGQIVLSGLAVCGGLIGVVALFTLMPLSIQEKLYTKSVSSSSQPTAFLKTPANAERFTQWKLGLQIGEDHPILGSGPGTTRSMFYQKSPTLANWDFGIAMDLPHNSLIQAFSQTGVLGFLSLLGVWVAVGFAVWQRRALVELKERPYYWSLLAGLGLLFSFNLFLFMIPVTSLMATIGLGILLAQSNALTYHRIKPKSLHFAGGGLLILSFLLLMFGTVRYLQAESAMDRARAAERLGTMASADKEAAKSIKLFPYDENYYRMAAAYRALRALQSPTNSRKLEAVQLAERSIELNPFIPKEHTNLAVIQYLMSDTGSSAEAAALSDIPKAIALCPYDTELYSSSISALLMKKDKTNSAALFTALHAIAPEKVRPFLDNQELIFKQQLP